MGSVAVVSDVHGNLTAFEAVVADIQNRGVDLVINLGDFVGKGPRGHEVVQLAQQVCDVNVQGNWDDFLPGYFGTDAADAGTRFWGEQLTPADCEWLGQLPFCADIWVSGALCRFFHASASSVHTRVRRQHSDGEFESMFMPTEATSAVATGDRVADVVGYGDIHSPYLVSGPTPDGMARTLFNSGSVGNNIGNPMPSYALIHGEVGSCEQASWSIEFVRVPYDWEAELAFARSVEMPMFAEYEQELRNGIFRGVPARYDGVNYHRV